MPGGKGGRGVGGGLDALIYSTGPEKHTLFSLELISSAHQRGGGGCGSDRGKGGGVESSRDGGYSGGGGVCSFV